jgi:hypothetical protein
VTTPLLQINKFKFGNGEFRVPEKPVSSMMHELDQLIEINHLDGETTVHSTKPEAARPPCHFSLLCCAGKGSKRSVGG